MTGNSETGHPLIHRLSAEDVERIHEIEKLAYPYPWTRGNFEDCFRAGYHCFGLKIGKDLAGYTIFTWAAGEAHLLNLCIHPEWQRRGFGSLLLEYTIGHVARFNNDVMYLEVRAGNRRAAKLYANRGFKAVGHRRSYYQAGNQREDAIVMRIDI